MRISDWSSDVCSSDLPAHGRRRAHSAHAAHGGAVPVRAVGDQTVLRWDPQGRGVPHGPVTRSPRLDAEYVLPLKWGDDGGLAELTRYLRVLSGEMDVTVVDGSEPDRFAAHAAEWSGIVRHLPVAVGGGEKGEGDGGVGGGGAEA